MFKTQLSVLLSSLCGCSCSSMQLYRLEVILRQCFQRDPCSQQLFLDRLLILDRLIELQLFLRRVQLRSLVGQIHLHLAQHLKLGDRDCSQHMHDPAASPNQWIARNYQLEFRKIEIICKYITFTNGLRNCRTRQESAVGDLARCNRRCDLRFVVPVCATQCCVCGFVRAALFSLVLDGEIVLIHDEWHDDGRLNHGENESGDDGHG